MFGKIILLFTFSLLFTLPNTVHAGLIINEIMYDLSGADSVDGKSREWIEVYNSDSSEVVIDASTWRIYDGGANRTINGQVDFTIPASSYVVFAGDKDTFLTDYPSFTGTVYDTGIASLNNTGATLKILDQDGVAVDEVTYASSQGGGGDGNSLQIISSAWSGATPTPGVVNEDTSSSETNEDNEDDDNGDDDSGSSSSSSSSSSSGGGSSSSSTTKSKPKQKIATKITGSDIAFVGLPVSLELRNTGVYGQPLFRGRYLLNFGDGDFQELYGNKVQKLTHTYFYEGEHRVYLEYYQDFFDRPPDAVDELIVKVVKAGTVISRVGDGRDFFIELLNNADYDQDISGWKVMSNRRVFTIPPGTILGPKKKMMISPKITGFSTADKSTLRLVTSEDGLASRYSAYTPASSSTPKQIQAKAPSQDVAITDTEDTIPSLPLSANVVESNSNPLLFYLIAIIFIGASAGATYFLRQKVGGSNVGDDFEILDE